MELLGFEVEAQAPGAGDLEHEAGRWLADAFGVIPRLTTYVHDLDAAVGELAAKGITADPLDLDEGTAVRLVGPAGLTVDLVLIAPAGEQEDRITEFIESAAELAGPPTAELAEAVHAIIADATRAIEARLEGVAHNKVLATNLLLGQQARGDAPDSPAYWQRSAASTLMSWFVGRGAASS